MKKVSFYLLMSSQILLVLILEYVFFRRYLNEHLPEHIILASVLIVVTATSYLISRKMIFVDPHYFIQTVIASTTIKLIVYVGTIALILYLYTPVSISYIFYFMACYLLVTTTEILYLVQDLRNQQNKGI